MYTLCDYVFPKCEEEMADKCATLLIVKNV